MEFRKLRIVDLWHHVIHILRSSPKRGPIKSASAILWEKWEAQHESRGSSHALSSFVRHGD